jgi:hypothetical protein
LVGLIGTAHHAAFAELYDMLSGAIREEIEPLLSAQAAAAVTRATFAEVWLMARLHVNDSDVVAWISGIARRRAHERLRHGEVVIDGGPERTAAGSGWTGWRADVAGVHDRRADLTFASALDPPRSEVRLRRRPRNSVRRSPSCVMPAGDPSIPSPLPA